MNIDDLKLFDEVVILHFEFKDEFSDSHLKEIIKNCKMLCEVFAFELKDHKIKENDSFYILNLTVEFIRNPINFDDSLRVLKAFAQEYQLTISHGQTDFRRKVVV